MQLPFYFFLTLSSSPAHTKEERTSQGSHGCATTKPALAALAPLVLVALAAPAMAPPALVAPAARRIARRPGKGAARVSSPRPWRRPALVVSTRPGSTAWRVPLVAAPRRRRLMCFSLAPCMQQRVPVVASPGDDGRNSGDGECSSGVLRLQVATPPATSS